MIKSWVKIWIQQKVWTRTRMQWIWIRSMLFGRRLQGSEILYKWRIRISMVLQFCGSGSAWIPFILGSRIRIRTKAKCRIRICIEVQIQKLLRLKMKPWNRGVDAQNGALEGFCAVSQFLDYFAEDPDSLQSERSDSDPGTTTCALPACMAIVEAGPGHAHVLPVHTL